MAKRINTVSGGYEIIGTPQIIPAANLIPFGSKKGLGGGMVGVINFEKDEGPDEDERLISRADSYADDMQAPFYELNFNKSFHPRSGFFKEKNFKKTSVLLEVEVQLYVRNKPSVD